MPLFFSGSILMVVAGMFDGIAAPIYRVYHDAAILADYAAGVTSSPYRAAGRMSQMRVAQVPLAS